MTELYAKPLTKEAFDKYGVYGSFLDPKGPSFAVPDVTCYRDNFVYPQEGNLTFSTLRCGLKNKIVDNLEYHNHTGEGCMILDNDCVMCLGIATPTGEPHLPSVEAFVVPKGTILYIRKGVWHWEPYPIDGTVVTVVVILPERTYVNDCFVKPLAKDDQIHMIVD